MLREKEKKNILRLALVSVVVFCPTMASADWEILNPTFYESIPYDQEFGAIGTSPTPYAVCVLRVFVGAELKRSKSVEASPIAHWSLDVDPAGGTWVKETDYYDNFGTVKLFIADDELVSQPVIFHNPNGPA